MRLCPLSAAVTGPVTYPVLIACAGTREACAEYTAQCFDQLHLPTLMGDRDRRVEGLGRTVHVGLWNPL